MRAFDIDLCRSAVRIEVGVSIAARVALSIGTGRLYIALAARRLPLSFTTCMARRIATSVARPLALTVAIALGVLRRALTLALALTGAVTLTNAAALAITGQPCRLALRNDLSRIDFDITRSVTTRFGLEIGLALRRRRLHPHMNARPQNRINL